MVSKYEREVVRLSKLPRAERYDELMDFPASYTFKVIGRTVGFPEAVTFALDAAGRTGVRLEERHSGQGKYVAITFTLSMSSGKEIDEIYTRLEALPGLAFLF